MIQARELSINSDTTVHDLYELVDMPYRITNKARVVLIPDPGVPRRFDTEHPLVLRVEWLIEEGDPSV